MHGLYIPLQNTAQCINIHMRIYICMYGCIYIYIYKYIGGLGAVRRPLEVPPDREIGFVSFVRASKRGEAACLRGRDYASLRWPADFRILLRFGSSSLIDHCVLHGIYQYFSIVPPICMCFMDSRRISLIDRCGLNWFYLYFSIVVAI